MSDLYDDPAGIKRKIQDARKEGFLLALAECPIVSRACRVSKVPLSTAYEWREKCPVFADLWQDCLQVSVDEFEYSGWVRGKKGELRTTYDREGNVRSEEYVADSRIWCRIMEAYRPDIYTRVKKVEVRSPEDLAKIANDAARAMQESETVVDDDDGVEVVEDSQPEEGEG